MDEARLLEKLRRIEALFSGATTEGEKVAAERARARILERLKRFEQEDPPAEYRFTMPDMWSRKVFIALLRRYGIRPYRYRGQRYTTVMARVSKRFVDETLWPEFRQFSDLLTVYLSEVTDQVVSQVIHQDSSEVEVVEKTTPFSVVTPEPAPAPPTTPVTSRPADQPQNSSASAEARRRARNEKKRKRKKRKRR